MKQIILLSAIIFLLSAGHMTGQIGIGTTTPDIYSMLDITTPNSNKGFLPPRVGYFARTNPSNFGAGLFPPPSEGMIIFDTDLGKYYSYHYNGAVPEGWRELDWDWARIDNASNIGNNLRLGVSGNVGIGTTNPMSKVTVVGNMSVGDSAFGAVPASLLGMNVQGRVGIGTSAPAPGYQLDVQGSQNVTGSVVVSDTLTAPTIVSQWVVPQGGVIMWTGNPTGNFDASGLGLGRFAGWALCNGRNGTTDLRGRFTVGLTNLDNTNFGYSNTEKNNAQYLTVGNFGGEAAHTLTAAEVAPHTHPMVHNHGVTDPGHTHTIPLNDTNGGGRIDDAGPGAPQGTIPTNTATTGISIQDFTGNTGPNAGGVAHENRPPYYVVAYIQKL
jgi:microcystin-dependent protein